MKKLLLTAIVILSSLTSNASHVLGGEISWRCLANGQYIFSMALYRDCTGIPWTFVNETIDIQGVPLPRDASGSVVSSITIRPDLTRLQNSNNGDTSPSCIPYENDPLSCADEDQGTVQAFYYNSAPVTLSGTPPGAGWKFFWQSLCCRPSDLENVNAYGEMLLRAVMYPGPNGLRADPCFDSSPFFKSLPTTLICRGYDFTFNHTAIDDDLDSMVYSWDRPYNPPQSNPVALTYKIGFSPTNPTPDRNFNINNIPATLNSLTGVTEMAVYSGNGIEKYITVVRVDAFRESRRVATIYREIPISIFRCPDLPGFPGVQNRVPEVNINGIPTSNTITSIVAGQTVSIPVQVIDNDRIDRPPFQQILTMVPDGSLFTQSRGANSPCIINSQNVEPCAYLRNSDPFLDTTATPPISVLKGLGVIGTEFVWQTDCKHIRTRTGFPGTNEGIYNFVMRVSDDHCPVPGLNYPTITVRVKDPVPLEEPIMKGISVNLDGTTTYSWAPPIDSVNQLNSSIVTRDHYEVYRSSGQNNQGPNIWAPLNTYLRRYKQDTVTSELPPYDLNDLTDPSLGYNILQPLGSARGKSYEHYLRMRTFSGCTDTNSSIWSDAVQIMKLNAVPIGLFPNSLRSKIRLTWNSPKQPGAGTKTYFVYESPTHYYVYANDSISNAGVADSSNWYLVGDTNATILNVSSGNCFDFSAFRVEARDTVITWKQGNGLRSNRLDTLYFSTFSIVDSIFVTGGLPQILNVNDEALQSSIKRKTYQWINCLTNTVLINDTIKTFIPSSPGFYKVVAISLGCSDTSACFEVTPIKDTIYSVGNSYLRSNSVGSVVNWVNCIDSSIVSGPSSTFVPNSPGNYAAIISKFGFQKYSACFTVTAINSGVTKQGIDFFEANEPNLKYQWLKKVGSSNVIVANETNRRFVPKSAGRYIVTLSKYGYSVNSIKLEAPILDNSVDIVSNNELVSADNGKEYQWINCASGLPIPAEVNQNLILTDTGSYAVIVKAFDYTEISTCTRMYAVGLDDFSFENRVSLYPNPTNKSVTINLQTKEKSVMVTVRNIQGQLVQEQQFLNQSNLELDIKGKAGVYFIHVTNEKGERANLKVVKQ
jgi:hypothetical protein